jgi:hypothetical protein
VLSFLGREGEAKVLHGVCTMRCGLRGASFQIYRYFQVLGTVRDALSRPTEIAQSTSNLTKSTALLIAERACEGECRVPEQQINWRITLLLLSCRSPSQHNPVAACIALGCQLGTTSGIGAAHRVAR